VKQSIDAGEEAWRRSGNHNSELASKLIFNDHVKIEQVSISDCISKTYLVC